jgi:hypothetical protein
VKFCPRLHPNPRGADFCRRCGSRDLSLPQPLPMPGVGVLKWGAIFAAALLLVLLGLSLLQLLLFPAG